MALPRSVRRVHSVMDSQIAQERERRMRAMRIDEIGGGRVLRTFKIGDRHVPSGETIDVETLRKMPAVNRNSLIDNGFLAVWPKGAGAPVVTRAAQAAAPEGSSRFVINKGFGNFSVVEGRLLNSAPLKKEEAEALAAEGQQAKH